MDYQRWVLRTHPRDLDGHDGSPEVKGLSLGAVEQIKIDPKTRKYWDFFLSYTINSILIF